MLIIMNYHNNHRYIIIIILHDITYLYISFMLIRITHGINSYNFKTFPVTFLFLTNALPSNEDFACTMEKAETDAKIVEIEQ